MIPFYSRSFISRVLVALRSHERQRRQTDFAADGFELFSLPIVKPKMSKAPRDLDSLHRIVTHVTAVTGGFGVSKGSTALWSGWLSGTANLVPRNIARQLVPLGMFERRWLASSDTAEAYRPTPALEGLAKDELAHRLALWERYRAAVPYHQIGAANGDNLANRELSHRTWHAGKGNDGVGWALDVGASETLIDWHVETGRASLRTLCARVLKASKTARADGILIAPHRAFSPSRRGDTGANVHQEIVMPVARELDCLEIDYGISRGRGRPIPDTWDHNATHDEHGRSNR